MLKQVLLAIRDARWTWDLLGPVYNHHIREALSGHYRAVAARADGAGPAGWLDVGTGRGYMALELAAARPESSVIGIDRSLTQVRSAERLRRRRGLRNASFRRADALDLPFADGSFDGVVSVGSIKHWSDPARGLAEIRRVLLPGGRLILSETDREASDGDLRAFMKRLSPYRPLDPILFRGLRHIVFGGSFSAGELAALAAGAGFGAIEAAPDGQCPYVILAARKEEVSPCT